MAYTVELLPDEPIVFIKAGENYDNKQEFDQILAETRAFIDHAHAPHFLLIDIRGATLNFSDSVEGAAALGRGEDTLFHHKHVAGVAVVTDSSLSAMVANALSSFAYGNINIKVFTSVAQAYEFIRA